MTEEIDRKKLNELIAIMLKSVKKKHKNTELTDFDQFLDGESEVHVNKIFQPIMIVDTANKKTPNIFSSGRIKVETAEEEPVKIAKDLPTDSTDANVPVTNGEIWKVVGIKTEFRIAAGGADRTCLTRIIDTPAGPLVNKTNFETTVITLPATKEGQIWLGESPKHTTNVDGTIAQVADENPLPSYIEGDASGTGTISAIIATNKAGGDRSSLKVFYKIVGEV